MANKIKKTTNGKNNSVQKKQSGFSDYLRFGESYTSLLLGIIAVIILLVLVLGFLRSSRVDDNYEGSRTLSDQTSKAYQNTLEPSKTPSLSSGNNSSKGMHVVAAGDSLWTIAEKRYNSGYNWVDIAEVNKLTSPDLINAGQKLVLPNVSKKVATSSTRPDGLSAAKSDIQNNKITGKNYSVVEGDNLWTISLRAYGDGYKWSEIAKSNKLPNPHLILPGQKLVLPGK